MTYLTDFVARFTPTTRDTILQSTVWCKLNSYSRPVDVSKKGSRAAKPKLALRFWHVRRGRESHCSLCCAHKTTRFCEIPPRGNYRFPDPLPVRIPPPSSIFTLHTSAEGEGFEPSKVLPLLDFESSAFDLSATPPWYFIVHNTPFNARWLCVSNINSK